MSQKRILVTGAASPLGQAVGRKLQSHGHFSIGTIRTEVGESDFPMFDSLVHMDLEQPETIDNLAPTFDSIIHIAAASTGSLAHLMQVTGIATARLADLALRRGTHNFIHISSMSVYGAVEVSQVSAKTKIRHSTPYGAAKWAAECYLNSVSDRLPAVSIRSCGIVGRRSHRNFLARSYGAMKNREPRVCVSNPDFLFNNVIHEDNLADFVVRLASTHESGFNAVPVGSSEPLRLATILEMMARETNYRGVIDWIPATNQSFSIDISEAVEMGLRPSPTITTINRWLEESDASSGAHRS
jgi:nucleoside-diphosphate-sugar epimerase